MLMIELARCPAPIVQTGAYRGEAPSLARSQAWVRGLARLSAGRGFAGNVGLAATNPW